jgi:hypothetical protein
MFYQNLAVSKPLGAASVAGRRPLLHADRLGLPAEPLNFSEILRTDSRIRSALKYRSGMACRCMSSTP